MTADALRRYRRAYRMLLRSYPKPYRERFAEGMEQTFQDLLRERAEKGKSLSDCALWLCAETSMGIIRENLTFTLMQNKTLLRPALVTLGLLLLPLLGNRFVEGCDWSPFDFLLMGALIFVTVLAFELIARKAKTTAYRAALGLALLASFLLLWINLAVGLIGSEDNPANLLYLAVLAIGFLGSLFARLQPRGMARTLFAMALAQMLVPTMAYIYWRPDFSPGVIAVFGLNAVFATLFIGSGLLFRQAGATQAKQS